MSDFGTVITFDLCAGFEAGRTFAESLRLFARTPSFGSTESLVVPPQMMQPRDFSPGELVASDIGPGTVRLSIGLEDPLDLQADLSRSLELASV
jgi:cystathionine beta-lyase/cystathionine gamma-synthase